MTAPPCILGIDPGLDGAMALFDPVTGALTTHSFATYKRDTSSGRRLDLYQLATQIRNVAPWVRACYMERVGAMPKQGLSSTFNFGVTYGALQATIASCGIALTLVAPAVWKHATACPKDKDGARARASAVFPEASGQWAKKSEDGKAEAALIAWYGAGHLKLHGHV